MDSSHSDAHSQIVHGERSVRLLTPEVDLHLTIRGGQLAPAIFHLAGGDVSPYALSPWEPAEFPELPPLLSVLRGDFFCLPFGPQNDGPPHGAPANHDWSLVSRSDRTLQMTLSAADSGAEICKTISVKPGHHAIYCEHRISGVEGDFSFGNHPILDLSGFPDGEVRISTSAFRWGSVYPGIFSDPARGETQALLGGSTFQTLRDVSLAEGGTTDLTRYPARKGNDDLVMLVNESATAEQPFAWSAVATDRWVWFALKDPADFPATLLWMSNGGRTAAPWNGRHLGRIGIEEVCSYFCDSVDASREDRLAALRVPTTRRFRKEVAVALRTVQAVVEVPTRFGAVSSIRPAGDNEVVLTGERGDVVKSAVTWKFCFPAGAAPSTT